MICPACAGGVSFFQRGCKLAPLRHYLAFLTLAAIACLPCSASQIMPCNSKSAAQVLASSRAMIDEGEYTGALQCLPRAVRPKIPDSVFFEVAMLQCEAHTAVGDNAAALDACMQAWGKQPRDSLVNLRLGNLHANAGNNSGAVVFFQAAIKGRPDSPIPRNNLALALQALGRKEEAMQVFEKAMVETDARAHGRSLVLTNLAVALPDEEEERKMDLLEEAYALDALDETAINIANTMCNERSSNKEKCEGCRVLLEHHMAKYAGRSDSFHPGVHRALAVCFSKLGMGRQATEVLQQSGALTGEATVSAAMHGSLHQVFEAAQGSITDLAIGVMTFGASLAKQSFFEKDPKKFIYHSVRACVAGLRLEPGLPTLRLRLDCAQRVFYAGQYRSAERMYAIALLRRYDNARKTLMQHSVALAAEAYNGIGASIEMQHERLDVSALAYGQAVKLAADYHTAFFSYAHIKVRLCDWRNRTGEFQLMEKLIQEIDASAVGPIFALHYPISQLSVRKVAQDRSRSFVQNLVAEEPDLFSPKFRALRPSVFAPQTKQEEFHIGFISADFNMRPVGKLVQSLPQLMNSYGSKISLWSLEHWDGSSVMHTITQGVALAEMVKGWSPFRTASAINAAKVHVLVDLNGYTEGGGTATCILRPAAVIVNFLGYPGTMGVQSYDVIVTDRVVLPPELYPNNFFERVLVMPHTYMVCDHHQSYPLDALSKPPLWAYNDTHSLPGFSLHAVLQQPRVMDAAPAGDKVVMANFNHLQKLGPDSFAQWMRIMKHVPDSFLWLLKFPAEAETHLHREAAAAGVNASRILFLDKVTGDEHLQSKRLADIFVDTFEYNAHVSGLDALWAGLPLLTLAGDRMARRACPSFLIALGLPELIARTDDDYGVVLRRLVAIQSRRHLLHFREEIASRRETRPLFDTPLWALHFFKGLKLAYERALLVGAAHAVNPLAREKSGPGLFHVVVTPE